ncbi:hypothetical protein [Paenibacillus sp. HW567]|uniref:hypothetical protein n=1 Tax=Paenibacillus sp. HW567 TaxID=1034769 RepID=UPI000370DDC4|nr:hypothetical protein [Paenibacillus sp. HW567]
MRGAESMPKTGIHGFSRSVHVRRMQRYRRRYSREQEAVLIIVLFLLLIFVLLYFS